MAPRSTPSSHVAAAAPARAPTASRTATLTSSRQPRATTTPLGATVLREYRTASPHCRSAVPTADDVALMAGWAPRVIEPTTRGLKDRSFTTDRITARPRRSAERGFEFPPPTRPFRAGAPHVCRVPAGHGRLMSDAARCGISRTRSARIRASRRSAEESDARRCRGQRDTSSRVGRSRCSLASVTRSRACAFTANRTFPPQLGCIVACRDGQYPAAHHQMNGACDRLGSRWTARP